VNWNTTAVLVIAFARQSLGLSESVSSGLATDVAGVNAVTAGRGRASVAKPEGGPEADQKPVEAS